MVVDLLVRDARIHTADGPLPPDTAIAVNDGEIMAIGHADSLPDANSVLDADGNLLIPGIVDCHVHARSPGHEYREDWETLTRSAAAGGVTTVIAMPNTDPLIDRPEHLRLVFELVEENAVIDAQSYGLLTADNIDQLEPLVEAGVPGFKCFLVEGGQYAFSSPDDGELHESMALLSDLGTRVGFHEENSEIVYHYVEKFQSGGRNRPIDQPGSRPVIAEVEAVSRLCLFAEDTGCPVHMFHVSSGSAAEVIADAKANDIDITAETMPHYLQFNESVLERQGNAARVNPPVRTEEERQKLWEIGIEGTGIDCIATDHAPYTDDEKGMDDPFQTTWDVKSGFVGVETEVPAMHTLVDEGRLSIKQWIDFHSRTPAQIWGLYPQKGSLQVGTDADFTIIDPGEQWTIDRHQLRSKSRVTPYDGETVVGKIATTVVRGNIVFDGEVLAKPGYGTIPDVDT